MLDIIEQIKIILQKKDFVYFSEESISLDPELIFFNHVDYDIFARKVFIYICNKKLCKKDFLKRLSKVISKWGKEFDEPIKGLKFKSKNVSHILWRLLSKETINVFDNIKSIKLELSQKFRTHCCPNLNCTDNASRRYFFRSPIVYVHDINAYVLTNYRKYIYNEPKDEYTLDQTIEYEILDYCPFCGENLKDIRLSDITSDSIIRKAIANWRDCAISKFDDGEEENVPITFYGINCYDSFYFLSKILSSKYSNFDCLYGINNKGVLRNGASFITVNKVFNLAIKYNLLEYFDPYPLKLERNKIIPYFIEKFNKREKFSEDDILVLTQLLHDTFWDMYHKPEYFDELAGDL